MSTLPTLARQFYETFEPFSVGFDELFRQLDEFPLSRMQGPMYPPYNVRKESDNHYVIELAVAGFDKNNIDIIMEDGHLTITGNVSAEVHKDNYLFKGIAGRAFSRSFMLADTVEIKNAELVNGMLKVYLENLIPLSKQAKKIPINGEAVESKPQLLNEKNGGQ